MLDVIDREPKGNRKNNIVSFNIPSNITTLPALISLLQNGCFADVFANNSLGENAGVNKVGTPINRALFMSIDEGGGGNGSMSDMCLYAGEAELSAGWTFVPFAREFMFPPIICATEQYAADAQINNESLNIRSLRIKDVSTTGFYATLVKEHLRVSGGNQSAASISSSFSFEAGRIAYLAILDTGIKEVTDGTT